MHRSPTHVHIQVRTGLAVVAIALGVLAGCGGSDDASPDPAPTTVAADAGAGTSGGAPDDAEDVGEGAAEPTGEPTGRLVLDGVTYPLTYDAEDPNAICQVLAVGAITVGGMRTPEGNRVSITISSIPRPDVMATYFDDDDVTLWSIATDGSSVPPEFEAEGTTARVSGRWFHRQDTSIPEVDGELEVTC